MSYQKINLKIEQPISIRENLYEQLKHEILSDKIPPKATLVETQLSKQIGLSRTPIREALHKSLEILAARWAIKRITPEEIQTIRKNLNNSEIMIKEGKLSSFIDLDAEFHELLGRASGSQRLLKLILTHRSDMLRYRIESLHFADTASIASAGHRRIFECLVEKDENGVESAVKDHIEKAKTYIQLYAFEDKVQKVSDLDDE
jgi:DNA-binding GntR family transcriptional regulator